MTNEHTGEERRAPQEQGWHLDKKVPLTLIFAMLMQAAMVVWAVADIKKDVELLKADVSVLHDRDKRTEDGMREAFRTIQSHYDRLEVKLDRLIERSKK